MWCGAGGVELRIFLDFAMIACMPAHCGMQCKIIPLVVECLYHFTYETANHVYIMEIDLLGI